MSNLIPPHVYIHTRTKRGGGEKKGREREIVAAIRLAHFWFYA